MIPASIEISEHAWFRFVSRWTIYRGRLPACPTGALRRLLAKAVRVSLGAGEVHRLLNHHLTAAIYYEAEQWRFVVSEDGLRLVTVERILVGKKKSKPRRRRY